MGKRFGLKKAIASFKPRIKIYPGINYRNSDNLPTVVPKYDTKGRI
jgi:hypothetical protein